MGIAKSGCVDNITLFVIPKARGTDTDILSKNPDMSCLIRQKIYDFYWYNEGVRIAQVIPNSRPTNINDRSIATLHLLSSQTTIESRRIYKAKNVGRET